jgi:hypothetical protein
MCQGGDYLGPTGPRIVVDDVIQISVALTCISNDFRAIHAKRRAKRSRSRSQYLALGFGCMGSFLGKEGS